MPKICDQRFKHFFAHLAVARTAFLLCNSTKIYFVNFIAILLQAKQFRTQHYGYGGYGYNQYSQYANSRMDTVDENGDDMMKMVGSALDNFQKINDDDNDKLNMPDYFY